MTTAMSFDEFVSNKRKRPVQICVKCGKHKEIYTHLDGEKDKPLCNTCNMMLRRESPGAIQVKLLKLCATAIGAVEAMLGLPVEEKQKKSLQDMQDGLKLMVRVWLGDTQAEVEADAATATAHSAEIATDPVSDEFSAARKVAVSEKSDKLFDAPKTTPSTHKKRAARKTTKNETLNSPEQPSVPNDSASDPAYQAYLEAPLA